MKFLFNYKPLLILTIIITFLSCSDSTDDIQISERPGARMMIAPALTIDIKLLKVPKIGSSSCKWGLGACVIISFGFEEVDENIIYPIEYYPEEETVSFVVWKIDDNTVEIELPQTLVNSPEHLESDFDYFEIGVDTNYGDVTLLEGAYPYNINDSGNLVYLVDA